MRSIIGSPAKVAKPAKVKSCAAKRNERGPQQSQKTQWYTPLSADEILKRRESKDLSNISRISSESLPSLTMPVEAFPAAMRETVELPAENVPIEEISLTDDDCTWLAQCVADHFREACCEVEGRAKWGLRELAEHWEALGSRFRPSAADPLVPVLLAIRYYAGPDNPPFPRGVPRGPARQLVYAVWWDTIASRNRAKAAREESSTMAIGTK